MKNQFKVNEGITRNRSNLKCRKKQNSLNRQQLNNFIIEFCSCDISQTPQYLPHLGSYINHFPFSHFDEKKLFPFTIRILNLLQVPIPCELAVQIFHFISRLSKFSKQLLLMLVNYNLYEIINIHMVNTNLLPLEIPLSLLKNITKIPEISISANNFFGIDFFCQIICSSNVLKIISYSFKILRNITNYDISFRIHSDDIRIHKSVEQLFMTIYETFKRNVVIPNSLCCIYNLFTKSVKWQLISIEQHFFEYVYLLLQSENEKISYNSLKLLIPLIKSGISFDISFVIQILLPSKINVQMISLEIIRCSILMNPNLIYTFLELGIIEKLENILKFGYYSTKMLSLQIIYSIFKYGNDEIRLKIFLNLNFINLILDSLQNVNKNYTLKILEILGFMIVKYNLNNNVFENTEIFSILEELIVNEDLDIANKAQHVLACFPNIE